jgi:hypothetical protein
VSNYIWTNDPTRGGKARGLCRWKRILISLVLITAVGICALAVVSEFVWEQSIDPRDTDVVYWNDGDQEVDVWECEADCGTLGRRYELKPGKFKAFTPSSSHPKPVAILIRDRSGQLIGCAAVGPRKGRPSLYAMVSWAGDCVSVTTPSSVRP